MERHAKGTMTRWNTLPPESHTPMAQRKTNGVAFAVMEGVQSRRFVYESANPPETSAAAPKRYISMRAPPVPECTIGHRSITGKPRCYNRLMERVVSGEREMEDFAAEFVRGVEPGERARVLALSGELGAGKTCFVRGIARSYGVSGSVTSPTYTIEKVYELSRGPFKRLAHIDAYRLQREEELQRLGWEALLSDKDTLVCIEWPERVPHCIPRDAKRLMFLIGEGEARTIRYD